MEKRTILAVVLSMVVMIGFMMIQNTLYPPQEPPPPAPSGQTQQESVTPVRPWQEEEAPAITQILPEIQAPESEVIEEAVPLQRVVIDTDLLRVTLTNAGGNIVSYQLKEHLDHGAPVEMIFGGQAQTQAFAVAFGNRDYIIAGRTRAEDRNFRVRRISDYIVEFSQDYATPLGTRFTFTKRYEFRPGEYMFELILDLNGGPSTRSFNFNGAAYTLIIGPQIGPRFEKLDQRYEYRHFLTYRGRMRQEKVNERDFTVISNLPSWTAVAGKYFTLVALAYASQFEVAFSAHPEPGLPNASRLFITRPAVSNSRIEDRYHFYMGPKSLEILRAYEQGENSFRLRDTGMADIADTRGFLAPLERVLKWLLTLFYGFIPNYGIAIILLTLVVKLVMFPLTKKGSEATLRMQALAPKMKELQDKYKDNKQKLNIEMAEFYKREGYNPISGCLPMLLQLPIFLAMFNLFNSHFDLRGAEFIPFWITDLSRPESIYNFPEGVSIPFLGWTALRLLPFIYVGSQLLYGKVTQTPEQSSNPQMKIMLYAMPIVFFFVLYDMPSGLLVYWILSNILTLVQQLLITKYMARKKAVVATETPGPVIAPGGSKKKKRK